MASLDAYVEATKDLKATHIEQFCVLDALKVAGTPDRVVAYQGQRYIADLKTGSIEWGALKIAMQLAVYARCSTYDIATAERGVHGADLTKGLIIHLPAVEDPKDAVCELFWVDLVEGWNAVLVARQVREKRALKFADLATPFAAPLEQHLSESIVDKIHACATADEVRALWTPDWTDELTAIAAAYVAGLSEAS
jgi:hypothetical protein